MDESPKNREISTVTGNAQDIIDRGKDVKDLGDQMTGSAGVLKAIVEGADGQKGLSIEKIRDVVGDIHVELRLAGERYAPTGTALKTYGAALKTAQEKMEPIVTDCQTLWSTYQSKLGDYNELNPWLSPVQIGPDAEAAEERRQADLETAQTAVTTARAEFDARAEDFDTVYDTWQDAFDEAAESIQNATDGGVSDGFWDKVDAFVDGMLVVLQYVGIALAILAFVIGGPIIAALGAIVAIATLLLTAYKAARGNASGWEIAFAIIGVVPFGSIAKFAGGAKVGTLGVLDDMVGGLGTRAGWRTIGTTLREMPTVWRTTGAQGTSFLGRITQAMGGSHALDDVAARIMGFGTGTESRRALTRPGGEGWGVLGHVFGHYGWVVNTPGQVAITGIGAVQDARASSQVNTWEAELAAS